MELGVVEVVRVRADGLREAIWGAGRYEPIEASSSLKSALTEMDVGCRDCHQTKKARQHEYAITGHSKLRKESYLIGTHTQYRVDPIG